MTVSQPCPICNGGPLEEEIGSELFEVEGRGILILNYKTYKCKDCGESFVDQETLERSGKELKAWKESQC